MPYQTVSVVFHVTNPDIDAASSLSSRHAAAARKQQTDVHGEQRCGDDE